MFRSNALLIIALVVVGGSATLFESSATSKFAGLKAIQTVSQSNLQLLIRPD